MDILDKHEITRKYKTLLNKAEINTINRISSFLGQADHESGLKPKSENLNYAAIAVQGVFGSHRISSTDAKKYGRTSIQKANQEAIANTVYGGEWGRVNLGNTQVGDGWKYRGRGIFQITGRANYTALTKYAQSVLGLNVDYVTNPDLLLNEADSIIAAIWYWNNRGLNKYADINDITSISKTINLGNPNAKGTPKGAEDRIIKTNKYKLIFK